MTREELPSRVSSMSSFHVFRPSAFSAKPRPSRIVQHKRAPNVTFVRKGSTHQNHHAAQHTGSNIIARFFRGALIPSHAYDQSELKRRRAEAEKILLACYPCHRFDVILDDTLPGVDDLTLLSASSVALHRIEALGGSPSKGKTIAL